jgi:hypothetical protein
MDTYAPDTVCKYLRKQGIEAEVVLNDNYLPAHLKQQAI